MGVTLMAKGRIPLQARATASRTVLFLWSRHVNNSAIGMSKRPYFFSFSYVISDFHPTVANEALGVFSFPSKNSWPLCDALVSATLMLLTSECSIMAPSLSMNVPRWATPDCPPMLLHTRIQGCPEVDIL